MGELDMLSLLGLSSIMNTQQQHMGNLQGLLGNQQQYGNQLQNMLGSPSLFRPGLYYNQQQSLLSDEQKALLAKHQQEYAAKYQETNCKYERDRFNITYMVNDLDPFSNDWYLRDWDIEFIRATGWEPFTFMERLRECKVSENK